MNIFKEAQRLRKANPKIKWSDAVSQAGRKVKGQTIEPKKKVVKKSYQTGMSNKVYDEARKAKPPGKRKSVTGKNYYEYRKNRSDMPGSLTGVSEGKLIGEIKRKIEGTLGTTYVKFYNAKTKKEKKELQKIITACKTKLRKLK